MSITIDDLINSAEQHGVDSEPDAEVGDLQTYLRVAFSLLNDKQKSAFFDDPEVISTRSTALGEFDS